MRCVCPDIQPPIQRSVSYGSAELDALQLPPLTKGGWLVYCNAVTKDCEYTAYPGRYENTGIKWSIPDGEDRQKWLNGKAMTNRITVKGAGSGSCDILAVPYSKAVIPVPNSYDIGSSTSSSGTDWNGTNLGTVPVMSNQLTFAAQSSAFPSGTSSAKVFFSLLVEGEHYRAAGIDLSADTAHVVTLAVPAGQFGAIYLYSSGIGGGEVLRAQAWGGALAGY